MAWIAPVAGAAISGLSSIVGGGMSSAAQAANNRLQMQLAQQEMQWQTDMSNTAEQRHVADLEKAGLNPALAYSTPAPVPGQAPIASTQPVTGMGQGVGQAGQAAVDSFQKGMSVNSAVNLQDSQAQKNRADAATTMAELPFAGGSAAATLRNLEATQNEINQRADLLSKEWDWTVENTSKLMDDHRFANELNGLQVQIEQANLQRSLLAMPRLQNDAAWQKAHPELSGWLQSAVAPASAEAGAGVNMAVHAAGMLGMLP